MKLLSSQPQYEPYDDENLSHTWGDEEYGNHLEIDEIVDACMRAMEPIEEK